MKIALAGNPNSGKTTLYNAITGKNERVGNWAGVTIEKKEAKLKHQLYDYENNKNDVQVVDLPGAYSMSPYTSEESITSEFVLNEKPDVIINIVDSTNLSRSLFFTSQLTELQIPVVIALNKTDMVDGKDIAIDVEKLAQEMNCLVVKTSASQSSDNGLEELISVAMKAVGTSQKASFNSTLKVEKVEDLHKEDKERYAFVNKIVEKVETRKTKTSKVTIHDKLDRIIANKWLGIPIFIAVMYMVLTISQSYVGPYFSDILGGWIETFGSYVEGLMGEDINPFLGAIVTSAIIDGVGGLMSFVPLIMALFFLLALLEDCGYMARVAVVMDRFFKKLGLSGKSMIPMIIGTSCAIPGIMASRTIKNERQRRTTAMLTPFITCAAKLPVVALIAAVFFDQASWVTTSMYFVGIVLIVIWAMLIQRITGERDTVSYFIMELPEYRFPSLKRATLVMFDRAWAFIKKAATIILLCNVGVQIMSMFTLDLQAVTDVNVDSSILAVISSPFAYVLKPLGFGVWPLAAAAIVGFIAKENVVGTIATVFGISAAMIDPDALALVDGAASDVAQIMGLTSLTAYSYLAFNMFTPPCFAAIGAMNAEMNSKKWIIGALGLQLGTGYTVAFLIYQIGTLATVGTLGDSFVLGLCIVALFVIYVGYLVKKGNSQKVKG